MVFEDLLDYTKLGSEAPLFVRTALGIAWNKWFPSDPAAHVVVPRQVLLILLGSLEKLKDNLAEQGTSKEIELAAHGSYSKMAGAAKKRRAQVVDATMGTA